MDAPEVHCVRESESVNTAHHGGGGFISRRPQGNPVSAVPKRRCRLFRIPRSPRPTSHLSSAHGDFARRACDWRSAWVSKIRGLISATAPKRNFCADARSNHAQKSPCAAAGKPSLDTPATSCHANDADTPSRASPGARAFPVLCLWSVSGSCSGCVPALSECRS